MVKKRNRRKTFKGVRLSSGGLKQTLWYDDIFVPLIITDDEKKLTIVSCFSAPMYAAVLFGELETFCLNTDFVSISNSC